MATLSDVLKQVDAVASRFDSMARRRADSIETEAAQLANALDNASYSLEEAGFSSVMQRINAASTPLLQEVARIAFPHKRLSSKREIIAAIEKRRSNDVFDLHRRSANKKAG